MSTPKPFASLGSSLLARKGSAKPAMRPQFGIVTQGAATVAPFPDNEDLGWNDMGEDVPAPVAPAPEAAPGLLATPGKAQRRSALEQGRRAAFTLRLDAERHLKLRIATTIHNRSAQQIVTEALDRFLADMPAIDTLATRVKRGR